MSDLIVTWPKARTFASYAAECASADRAGKLINYHVRSCPDVTRLNPDERDRRLYRVNDGRVRGFTYIKALMFHSDGVVARVESDPLDGSWPAGWYIVCYPKFHDCKPLAMEGFRGYHYFDRTLIDS